MLILLYPFDTYDTSSKRIERIRTLYKDEFDQQSVLRVDDPVRCLGLVLTAVGGQSSAVSGQKDLADR